MAWRSSQAQWNMSQAQWQNWRKQQDTAWVTPHKVRQARQKRDEAQAAMDARVAVITDNVEKGVDLRASTVAATAASKKKVDYGIEARKLAGTRIKHALALKATTQDPNLIKSLDAEIASARVIANGGKSAKQTLENAIQAVAEAEAKAEKAKSHLVVAQQHVDTANLQLEDSQVALQKVLSLQDSPGSSQIAADTTKALSQMAQVMSHLKLSAVTSQPGIVTVDPSLLNILANSIQELAGKMVGVPTISVATPVRPTPLRKRSLASAMESAAEASESAAVVDDYLSMEDDALALHLRRASMDSASSTTGVFHGQNLAKVKKLNGNKYVGARIRPLHRIHGKSKQVVVKPTTLREDVGFCSDPGIP